MDRLGAIPRLARRLASPLRLASAMMVELPEKARDKPTALSQPGKPAPLSRLVPWFLPHAVFFPLRLPRHLPLELLRPAV
jgi:hypothetical protein